MVHIIWKFAKSCISYVTVDNNGNCWPRRRVNVLGLYVIRECVTYMSIKCQKLVMITMS